MHSKSFIYSFLFPSILLFLKKSSIFWRISFHNINNRKDIVFKFNNNMNFKKYFILDKLDNISLRRKI